MGSGRETSNLQRTSIWGIDDDAGYYALPLAGSGTAVKIKLPLTAFGDVSVSEKTSQVQLKWPYGKSVDIAQELTNNVSSTVTYADSNAIVTCAGTANAFSQIRSQNTIRYSPGIGSEFVGTCIFTAGVANSSQVFGAGDDDEGFYFGTNGTAFGILHRRAGSLEVKSITITGPADGTGGTFTITLDGVGVTVTVAASDTISEVVAAIVALETNFLNAGRGWEVHTEDNLTVHFISLVAENAAGSFSFADVDSGVTAGAFSEIVAGVAPTDTWTAQASWNTDVMDGTGTSGMTLDITKGNIYKIEWQYLGYGPILYYVENSETGQFQLVHMIKYANSALVPSILNPTLHCNMIAKTETGYSGGALVMKTSSMAGYIQGKESNEGRRRSVLVEKSMTTTEGVILIISNGIVLNGKINKITVFPDLLTYGSESAKTTTLRIYKDVTGITGAAALTPIQAGVSVVSTGTTGTTFTGGQPLLSISFFGGSSVDLSVLLAKIKPEERIVITGKISSGAASLVDLSLTWVERI